MLGTTPTFKSLIEEGVAGIHRATKRHWIPCPIKRGRSLCGQARDDNRIFYETRFSFFYPLLSKIYFSASAACLSI